MRPPDLGCCYRICPCEACLEVPRYFSRYDQSHILDPLPVSADNTSSDRDRIGKTSHFQARFGGIIMQFEKAKSFLSLVVTACVFTAVGNAQTASQSEPLARIDNQPIYDQDLSDLISAQLMQLRNQEYELKSNAITYLVNQRLLEAEAKSKGLSADAF